MTGAEIAALVLGVAGVGAQTGNMISAGKMNKRAQEYSENENRRNRQFQAEQAQIGRDWQEEMYNMYYSPSAQMQSFKSAGINPVLAAGQITGSSSGMSSPSASGGSQMQPYYATNPADGLSGMISQLADIAMLKQNIDESQSRIRLNDAMAAGEYSDIDVNSQTIEKMKTDMSKTLNDITNDNQRLANETKEINAIYDKLMNDIEVGKQNVEESKQNVEESKQRIEESKKRISEMNAKIRNLNAQTDLTSQQKTYLASQVTMAWAAANVHYAEKKHIDEKILEQQFVNNYLEQNGTYPGQSQIRDFKIGLGGYGFNANVSVPLSRR